MCQILNPVESFTTRAASRDRSEEGNESSTRASLLVLSRKSCLAYERAQRTRTNLYEDTSRADRNMDVSRVAKVCVWFSCILAHRSCASDKRPAIARRRLLMRSVKGMGLLPPPLPPRSRSLSSFKHIRRHESAATSGGMSSRHLPLLFLPSSFRVHLFKEGNYHRGWRNAPPLSSIRINPWNTQPWENFEENLSPSTSLRPHANELEELAHRKVNSRATCTTLFLPKIQQWVLLNFSYHIKIKSITLSSTWTSSPRFYFIFFQFTVLIQWKLRITSFFSPWTTFDLSFPHFVTVGLLDQ